MKTTMKKIAKTIALMLGLAAVQTAAAGDIAWIKPCTADGTIVANTSDDIVVDSGSNLYFKVVLVEKYLATLVSEHHPWRLQLAQEGVDEGNLPKFGIYVSGKKTYAEYVRGSQVRDESTGLTSLIFKYTTRAGDLALPIVASRADSTPADQDSSNNLFDVDLGDWILTNNYDTATCDFTFIDTTGGDAATGGVRVRDLNSIDGYDQVQDYDLRGCNFYVQTVDFDRTLMEGDDGVKTSPEWRIVHEGSTTTITEALNKLKTVGGGYLTEQGVFYVWSDNEESSYVKAVGGTDVTTTSVTTNYEGGTALVGDLHIAEVRIYGDSNLSQNFDIYGVKSNTTANLVLSPWKGYRFNAANQRIDTDYITIPVTVTNALPTSIQLSVTENVTATSDYLRSAGTITLKWSDAQYDNDVNVTLTPTFYDADDALAADWTDYFRIATTATKVDEYYYAGELPTAQQSRDALTVTLKAHDSSATTLYILALTGDERTGTAAHHFTITATAPAAEFPEQTESGRMPTDKQLYIEAEAPSVTYGGFVPASPRQSDSADLIVVVTNVYADAADTATGYTLNFYPDAGGSPETLDGTYAMHPTLKRLVKLDNGAYTTTLPSYTYTTSGTLTSRIEVVSPISGLTAYTDFEVTVRPVRTATIAADAATYNEGDQMTVTVEISEKHSSDKLYAFLRATKYDGTDLTDTGAFSETKCVITSDSAVDTSSGWEVDAGTTTIYIPVQDGSAETKNMRFTLRLCKSQVYSAANDVTSRYKLGDTTRPSPLVVTLANVAPVIPSDVTKAGFTVNGYALKSYIDESGVPYLPKKLIPGEKLRITPDITDVAYDIVKNLKWTITASHHADDTDNTTEPPDPVIITNTTSTITAYNDYELPGGKWNVTIFATDKDGEDSGSYTFWVEIVDESKIRLAVSTEVSGETSDVFDETSTRATVSVNLPYYDNQNLLVKLTVTPPSSGFIELDSAYKQTAHDGYPDLGDNEYYILFRGQGTETISVTAMDGTTVSAAQGFSLQAEVVTTNVYAKANKAWNEYYAKSRVTKVFVNNATPQFGNCTTQNTESNAWRVAGGSASAIKWAVDLKKECMYDITNEWTTTLGGESVTTNGIKVTIDGCSNGGVFFADSATPGGNFQPVFSSDALGVQAVTINIEDKDGDGPEQLTYYYEIVAAKYLTTVATGPSTGNADISLSTKYGAAKGIGEGHVWVSGATHNGTENFFAQWNCNLAVKVLVYAFGYMADDIDNGNLNKTADGTERDIWIDAYGNHKVNATKPTSDDEFYRNSDNTYDSFFYGWIKASEPGGTDYSVSYAPQVGTNKDVTAQIALPTAMTDDEIGYPETYIEAIFSREYSYYDNLGDINRDGIPDIFARYEYVNGALSSFDGQAGELPAVNSKNDDGDYYPGSSHIGESATPPGAVSGWETSGQGFTAFREIRGYHDGLNYGMFRYDATERKNGWISDLEMSDLEKKALLREVFKRRDYLTNKLLTTQLTNDGVNNEIREYELITNLLAQVYYKGASQGSGQVFFRMSDEEIAANTSPVEVVTTNVVGDVTTVETNLVNAWIRTFRPAYATEDTVVTNFFAEAVSNELDNVLRIPNPSDSLSYEHVDIGNWLDLEYNNNARAQQETAKAWITYTWRHIERAGQWGFTVENRTDPTTDDTDGDDMPDGYEYYMWYCAMVGTGTNEMTGCRFNLADVESYDDIIDAETIRDLYNPNKYHDWTRTDTDNDGIMDYEEFLIGTSPIHWDSDRDGLSDLYEVIYNINPVSAAGGSNGAVNGDGDFMAFCQNPDGTNYWVYAVLGSDGTTTNLWAIYTDDAVEIDTNEVQQTVTGWGCQVAMFNGGYIPVTENTKVLTRTISKNILTSVTPTNAPLSLYHHQVHNYFGFDPRTGWYSSPAGLSSGRFGLIAGKAVNTSAFKAIDEFRLIKYRYIVGLRNAEEDQSNINANKTTMHSVILAGTTNPSANFESRTWGDSETTYAQSQHGADTDGDAVPDGWELYVGVDPNRDFRIVKGSSGYDSLYWDGNGIWPAAGDPEIYTDGMTLAREYAGTDSCGAYSGCSTIYANHPSQANSTIVKWFNKFMPTDPHNDDTDGDGLDDGEEGKNWTGSYTMNRWGQDGNISKGSTPISGVVYHMFYGNPSDDDSTCIAGGGYNPCSIDTDGDALPDPWEHQYTGLVFKNDQIMTEANSGEGNYVFPPTTGVPGSVYDDIRAAVSALGWWEKNITNDVWHIIMGMDGTVADAYSYTGQKSSDLDWDGDGLQNWQEYMVQAMRHLRYDDDKTPLMGRDIPAFNTISGEFEQGSWNGDKGFLKISYSSPIDSTQYHTLEELGYKNFVAYLKENSDYLRDLGYFAEPPMEWDYAKLSLGYVYMLPPKCARPLEARATTSYTQLLADDHGVWGYAAEGDDEYVMASRYSGTTITNTTDSLEVYDPTLDYADGTILNYYNIYYVVVENDPDDASVQYLDRVVRLATSSSTTYHVTSNLTYKARGYVGTDPRLWDTDEDGMDDYYEIFHGLNPILGNVGTISSSTVTNSDGSVTSSYSVDDTRDVIADMYGNVTGMRNGWVGWNNLERPAYDAIRYPWMMGEGLCDADGDGLRNFEESIAANLTDPQNYHTDPTPLWMTDSSGDYTNYAATGTAVITNIDTSVSYRDPATGQRVYRTTIITNELTYGSVALMKSPSYVGLYYSNFLRDDYLTSYKTTSAFSHYAKHFFSFEENEGYDTDNDWRSDDVEMRKTVEVTSDPLNAVDLPRRQSIWFGGASEPGAAISYELSKRSTLGYDLFKQFTLEAWVRPEEPASGQDQYIVSRASNYAGWDLANSESVIRMNFALGVDSNGNLFGEMQNSTDTSFRLTGGAAEAGVWTHLAATYDGTTFRVYVNGAEAASISTKLIPANGVISTLQDPQYARAFPYEIYSYAAVPSATILGARANGSAAFDVNFAGNATAWSDIATDFFKGSVAEVRIWDGARSAEAILADRDARYTVESIKALRDTVYAQYHQGARRTKGNLNPELVQHFGFDSLPGATETQYVVIEPAGFASDVVGQVQNPDTGAALTDAVKIGWWSKIAENPNIGTVYSSPYVVPWIENTVAHLPKLSGVLADSVFWGEQFAGYTPSEFHDGLDEFKIANSMNPYNIVTLNGDEIENQHRKFYRVSISTYGNGDALPENQATNNNAVYQMNLYDRRMAFNGTTDLIPLGSAFAKRLSESWDGEGPEDPWARTTDGSVADGDVSSNGIPQWAIDAGYTTIEDYLAALFDGLLPDGNKDKNFSRDYYFTELAKRAFYVDENGNEIPDWWETYFGINGCEKNGDEDNDGLSNYQEFLISFGDYSVTSTRDDWSLYEYGEMAIRQARNIGMPLLSPVNAHSTGEAVVDYFLKPDFEEITDSRVTKNSYLGEMVTDHDQMELWWELKNNVDYSNAYVYDPHLDNDGDGWANFAEARGYSWNGGFRAADVDGYYAGSDGNHYDAHPKPAIGVRVTYNGVQNINGASMVVRTSTDSSKRIDATFRVRGTKGAGSVWTTHMLGTYPGETVAHGFLHPGYIVPGSEVKFGNRRIDAEPTYYWHCKVCENAHSTLDAWDWYDQYVEPYYPDYTYGHWTHDGYWVGSSTQYDAHRVWHGESNIVLDDTTTTYEAFARSSSDEQGQYGTINLTTSNTENTVIGKINFISGEYEIDLGAAAKAGVALDANVIRVEYSYQVADEWPKTVWLSDTTVADGSGYVKEGKNTVEAFIDLDGSGTYDIGEPYGALRDVEIGWHKTGEPLVIELTDDSTIVKRTAIATETSSNTNKAETVTEGLTTSIVVRRSAVNGDTSIGRRLSSSTIVLDDRAYVTEADILGSATSEGLDLDWKWLSVDAANKLGKATDVRNATYEILLQGETNPIATFTRTFSSSRGKAQILAPVTSAPVYSARPTVTFACDDETMTAYCLQIATSASEGDIIWSSGTKRLPGRTPYSTDKRAVYAVTPEIYVDTFATTNGTPVFADGGKYYARVALMNSKFNNTDDENCWSAWAEFQMDVANALQNSDTQTGYGNVAAAVRYYGAGAVTDLSGVSNVVVEAYNTADFTGAPVARTRLASIEGIDSASDVTTTNVVMSGIAPGTVYLMAYIDSNNNGKRDAWESWGYANRIGEDTKFLYMPKSVEVTDANYMYQSATIYIEDADLNQNEIPDILEGPVSQSEEDDPALVDSDGDGLMDVDETDYYGTNPYDADTDDDGIPDGYEVATGSDPLTADADTAGKGDYMAYAEVEAYVFETNGVAYVLNVDKGLAYETAAIGGANGTLVTTSLVDGFSLADLAGTVTNAFSKRSVVLVHSAVYDWFGYDSTTARDPATLDVSLDGESTNDVSTVLGPNTVPFTAFWKYFTSEFYLPAYGIELDTPMTIASLDYDANGLPDGWELYVKYAAESDPEKPDDEWRDDYNDKTDPNSDDTDGDGINDDTERVIGTDPLTPDADFSVENDVMAYATIDARIVTVDDFCGPVELVVTDSSLALTRGDALTAGSTAGVTLRTAWHYGNESNYVWAVGRKFEIEEGKSWRIVDVIDNVKVALVHSQVYDEFGFNPQTANPTVSSNDWASVNSKAFTALDKSLVARWLVEIGLVDEAADWKGYMLDATTPDANKDGIPDGWELYLMFGPEGTGSADSVEAAKISPWMPPVRAMEEAPDGGGLTIAEEYDNGNEPTDPWNAYTIEGPISDAFVKAYHLKGDEAAKDNDGDGLSNYAEYLITEIFKFAQLDPDKSSSNGETLDYYQKFGNLYLGELFTDHDRIGDTWEAAYEFGDIDGRDYAARGIYDSDLDLDRDGWSNYAEFRAGTNPTTDEMPAFDDYKTLEYPVPVIDLEIVYNGSLEGQDITVQAWNQEKSSNGGSVLGAPDAVWQVSKSEEATSASGSSSGTLKKFVGLMPGEKRTFYIGPGAVKAGTFKLCVMDRQFAICTLVTNPLTGELIPNVTGLGKPDDAKWYNIAIDQNGQIKTIGGMFGEDTTFGTIDYKRGVVTIDFTDEHFSMLLYGSSDDVWNESSTGSSSSSSSSSSTYDLLDLENSYVLLAWESAGVGSAVAGRYYLADTTSGHLREGLTTFTVEVTSSDTDTDSQSTDTSRAGLYAVARNVDVGWAGAKFKVELTDFSPITPRIDLWSDASDRTESVYNADPRIANSGDGTNTVTATTATGERTRVRVVRFAVNGYPSYSSWDNSAKVILDRYYQLNGRTKFSELDFLTDDEFDIDWNTFQGEIANRRQITERSGNVTNMSYLVVFGEGTASWVDASDASAITAHKAIINRRYDYTRAKAVAIDVDNGIQYGARPTFRWRIDGEDPWTAKFGSSYTAFKIQLAYKSFNSTGMIWESGFQRMPACNANGEYEWTAPICVGDMATTNGIYKAAGGSYIWRVSVYNSKFTNNDWSDRLSFTTAAGAQQDLNDHGYSKIKVAVKYAGHPRVLERAANLTTLTGKVRVQAFSTPDFAGDPLASAVVTNATAIADLGDALPNAELRGLAANGTYYIRAYIDMDGDCELDDWESWGYAKGDVTLSSDLTAAPVATVWIEDSDTDGDWYPDAYEFVRNGWTAWEGVNHNFLSDSNPSHTELGQIAVDADGVVFLPFSATNTLTGATFSSTLPGASLSVFQSKAFINALFIGSTFDRNGIAILDFNEAAKGAITPNTFKITNMVLDRDAKVVRLTVNAEVASAIAGTVVSKYYSFAGSDSVEVTIKVYKKDTLLEKDWKLVGTFPATIKNDTDEEVEVSLGDDIDLTSGFFMIEAEEAQAGN